MFGSGLKSPRKKKKNVADFALVHPPMASVLLSASVERCFVSRMRDFFFKLEPFLNKNRPYIYLMAILVVKGFFKTNFGKRIEILRIKDLSTNS